MCSCGAQKACTKLVAEFGALVPPGLRRLEFLWPAGACHHHDAEKGHGIDVAKIGRLLEQATGLFLVCLAAKSAQLHETEIEHGLGKTGIGRLRVIGPRGREILMDAASMMQHGTEIVGCTRMAEVCGTSHQRRRFDQALSAFTLK